MHLDLTASIQAQASQCVKCGLCLPHCPTYGLTQNENESPRGRIALMQNIATGALSLSPKAHDHIDNCLSCKECERVCPAQVPYERLLLDYRAWERPKLTKLQPCFFEKLISYPKILKLLTKMLWAGQQLGLRTLAKNTGLLKLLKLTRLNALLPQTLVYPRSLKPDYPAIGPKQGTVALFSGCLSTLFDPQTNQDAILVLQHLGYEVHVPVNQTCCGAIASHSGQASQAQAFLNQNIAAFSALDLTKMDRIITTASGCASMLINNNLMSNSKNTNQQTACFSDKIIDISDFICQITWPEAILTTLALKQSQFAHEKIAIHTPCTLRNSLKKPLVSQNLLEKLGLHCQPLQSIEQCCGSAGTHMLSHPATSELLLDSALINLDQIASTRLVTANIGCALHFQKRLTEQNNPIQVCHPISLFAEMLANS